MVNPLLDRVLPQDLAERGQAIEQKGKIGDFPRLVEIVDADLKSLAAANRPRGWRSTPVDIRLGFSWADARREFPLLEGEVSTDIAAVCQRCLEPVELPIRSTLKLLLLEPAQAAVAHGDFETWEIDGDMIRPIDIVEEALIMALPLSAMHPSRELCGPLADNVTGEAGNTARPFGDLRSLMEKTDN